MWTLQPLAQTPPAPPPAQSTVAPTNDAPNPYQTIEGWAKMPEGRDVGIDERRRHRQGRHDRSGSPSAAASANGAPRTAASCRRRDVAARLGAEVRRVGQAGQELRRRACSCSRTASTSIATATSGSPTARTTSRRAAAAPPPTRRCRRRPRRSIGHQVIKFSPEGKVLLTLGKAGGNRPGEPADPCVVLPAERRHHERGRRHLRRARATATRRPHAAHQQVRQDGQVHQGVGQARQRARASSIQPHALALDSKGRLFVADRSQQPHSDLRPGRQSARHRLGAVQPHQRPLDRQERHALRRRFRVRISVEPKRPDWKRGIRIGSIRDGKDRQDPVLHSRSRREKPPSTSAAEGVAVDAAGNIYGAEVGPAALKRYVKK